MLSHRSNRKVLAVLGLLILAACGGGGGGDGSGGTSSGGGGGTGAAPAPTSVQMGGAIQGVQLALAGATSTLAGSAVGTDGPRAVANYYLPGRVVSDGTYAYVADTGSNTIRVIAGDPDLVSVSSTLAGQAGVAGFADGTGSAARFNGPDGLALDGAGNLYVADSGNHVIRKIVIATRAVTTFAGTAGVSGSADGALNTGKFFFPRGVAYASGTLYVSDTNNCTLRTVSGAGVISTLAGTAGACGSVDATGAAARFNYPQGLVVDASGSFYSSGTGLWVADTFNHTIRFVTTAGVVTTALGAAGSAGYADSSNATATRFNYPTDVAFKSTSSGPLYVADSGNNAIRSYTGPLGTTSTLAGDGAAGSVDRDGVTSTVARFRKPQGVFYDASSDDVWVADAENYTVRAVAAATGNSTTVSNPPNSANGTGATGRFYEPAQIATDGTNLYLADPKNGVIRKIVIATRAVTTIGCSPCDGTAYGITTDGVNVYVANASGQTIRQIEIATGIDTPLAGLNGSSGSADGFGATARFNNPNGITTDGTNLYIADSGNLTIRKIVIATQQVTTLAGSAGVTGSADGTGASALFNAPAGITTDGTNLYVTDRGNHTVRKIAIATGAVTTLAGTAGLPGSTDATGAAARFNTPNGISTDGTNLYVADWGNHTVRRIAIATGAVTTLAGTAGAPGSAEGTGAAAGFRYPYGVTNTGSKLYVTDSLNATVRAIQ